MIEDDILRLVQDHYNAPNAELLLLSDLGLYLSKANHWPSASEKRSLFEVVDATPGIGLVRDPDAKAYIAVVLSGEEPRAAAAISERRTRFFLRGLPRAFLLAFTVDMLGGQTMSVRLGPKISYSIGPAIEGESIVVEDDLRIPGLDISNLFDLNAADVERLEVNIRAWCERHRVDPKSISRAPHKAVATAPVSTPAQSSALERLYAAQDPDVARRLSVPIDIALALSRMP